MEAHDDNQHREGRCGPQESKQRPTFQPINKRCRQSPGRALRRGRQHPPAARHGRAGPSHLTALACTSAATPQSTLREPGEGGLAQLRVPQFQLPAHGNRHRATIRLPRVPQQQGADTTAAFLSFRIRRTAIAIVQPSACPEFRSQCEPRQFQLPPHGNRHSEGSAFLARARQASTSAKPQMASAKATISMWLQTGMERMRGCWRLCRPPRAKSPDSSSPTGQPGGENHLPCEGPSSGSCCTSPAGSGPRRTSPRRPSTWRRSSPPGKWETIQ